MDTFEVWARSKGEPGYGPIYRGSDEDRAQEIAELYAGLGIRIRLYQGSTLINEWRESDEG